MNPVSDAALGIVAELEQALGRVTPATIRGRVSKAVGMLIDASGIQAHVGELCELVTPGEPPLLAEVVGFRDNTAILTPLGPITGISALTEVLPTGRGHVCPVGAGLLGRVLDALGQPIDEKGPLKTRTLLPVHREPVSPLARRMIEAPLPTGIRAVDSLLTLGEGQRVGVFAPPGVGKSTLLGMLARGATADVNVIALIGERGREVKEFIEHNLGAEGLAKTVMVVSTSDRPPMERIKSAYVATTIAEHFRDQGKKVLLLVDSLTRFARAQREIGLASGEPPTRRSYPPSIFSMLPQLLERAGQGRTGSITAVYSVLTEGDEESDPIAEEVRSILDGHIVLSRKVAAANRYPAIDVLASISRVMPLVTSREHRAAAAHFRGLLAKYQEMELLVQIGEYKAGADALADEAIGARPAMLEFLSQPPDASLPYAQSVEVLRQFGWTGEPAR
ncbi:ATP synthase in type III secretion protein N [Variovorax sp. YR750]|uniref:FliI/YscN family ATPase n=1 Tax=unclassified Variovorax TaxID=663243 RepID=UPI00089550FD|nr:ATP synthase in type III secretion protein N [Variovorax sp. NFACC28]SEG87424.1 ATP synthase in type III secretion protein N [Variovorax sp. NFACC29]SEL32646.1 ATP synthase in type III secretion protein N [Variovorax sp. YR750]SFD28811.1 ATP synthase in type III secretion protein N [Variovorax sp. NFACC26]SFG33601.1 ATP synthase in type III secretion protein N [Variovorax sp. NFACC27]